ncbi:hypothetical protein CO660_30610 [Rhizobium sp. L9]|nr:hypothetical protein CO660_30610 [Rhizobium sp. L9]
MSTRFNFPWFPRVSSSNLSSGFGNRLSVRSFGRNRLLQPNKQRTMMRLMLNLSLLFLAATPAFAADEA